MAVKRKYRLNLRNYGNLPAIMLSQYDEGYALEFEIRDGTDAASDLSDYTVTLKGTRADTLAYSFAGTISTNVLTFVIDTTMTACAGRGTAEIAIKDTANDVLFATFNMPVFVERAAVPEGSIDADVERAQEIAEQVQEIVDNAAATVSGEAEKWATGQIDGTDVPSTDPAYENNAKYYAEQAETAAESIGIDATLTQAGKAADAKKTGDEITALKEDLSEVDERVDNIVGQSGESNTEIVDARQDALGVTHNNLRKRLLTDYHNIADLPSNTVLFAERVLQYDYPFEHTLNGLCCDDDYFYITSVARTTLPEDFKKTKILKISRTSYEIVAEVEGDFGHANSLAVDRRNHVLYSAKCYYYDIDAEGNVKTERSNDINVFDVSGESVVYQRTLSTGYRSGSVAFYNDTLFMYFENGAIFSVDTETGIPTPYCTLSSIGTNNLQQSIDVDENFIYRLVSTDSSVEYSGGIIMYDHEGNFINQVAIANKFRVGFVEELEDLTIENGVVYIASCQTDRTEPAPYNNLRNVLVQKIYLTNKLPNINAIDSRFRANNPTYRQPITMYVDCRTQQYKADGTSAFPFKKLRDALFYIYFCDAGRYFINVKGGRYSETLKFENMAGVSIRINKWGEEDVIFDKPIKMFDGEIEFRQITFDVTNNPEGTLVCDASWNSEPLRLSLRNCNFIASEPLTGTHYGIYNSKIFGASIHIVSDTYDTNASGIIHYAPYCRTELWSRPNDRVNKDVFRINGGNIVHSRIELNADTRIDKILNPGVYMITKDSVGDLPSGSNGWLIVLSQPLYGNAYDSLTKQIFIRMGTAGKTDNHVYFRTYGGVADDRWGEWYEFAIKEGNMPSGTTVTFGYSNFSGYMSSSKKEIVFMIPLNFEIPSNLTDIKFVQANITVRNNGTSVVSIGLEDSSKITSCSITPVSGIGARAVLKFNPDFVNANFGSMFDNDVVNVYFQSKASGLIFTDPNARPDTPDDPDDSGEDPVGNASETSGE